MKSRILIVSTLILFLMVTLILVRTWTARSRSEGKYLQLTDDPFEEVEASKRGMAAGSTFQHDDETTDFGVAKFTGQTLPAGTRKVWTVDGIDYAFRWCPPGEFMMGEIKYLDEQPVHKVSLTRGFWLLETEVTQTMWESVMGESPSDFIGANNPVECVNWDECQEFCRKLGQKLGMQVRLPTEAQWEYACRAGSETALPNGPIEIKGKNNAPAIDPIGWYGGNSCADFTAEGYDSSDWPEKQYAGSQCGTHPVGKKEANAWGLYDMIGNVCEWCADWYGEDYYSESPTSDPNGPDSGSPRVIRGGGWASFAKDCRSAHRYGINPMHRSNDLGFRVLVVPAR